MTQNRGHTTWEAKGLLAAGAANMIKHCKDLPYTQNSAALGYGAPGQPALIQIWVYTL